MSRGEKVVVVADTSFFGAIATADSELLMLSTSEAISAIIYALKLKGVESP